MSGRFDPPDAAATPLTDEEKHDLKLSYISHRGELNAAEQENIVRGWDWALRRRRDLLSGKFIRELHRRMLGDVWRWAGTFRTSARNLGIDPWEIPVALRLLLDDAKTWIEKQTYPPDEIAVRLHHRLVHIHPFPNGNGRHARLMADLLIVQLGGEPFPWGRESIPGDEERRQRYLSALRAADRHDIRPLLAFARDVAVR